MTKILLLSEIFPPVHGGSGRWFSEIYGRFPRGSVCFLVGNHPEERAYDDRSPHIIFRANLSSREWGIRSVEGLKFYFRVWRQARRIIRQQEVTHVHCGRCLPEGLVALMLRLSDRIPYTCYVHGEDVETTRTSRELTWLTRQVMKYADEIICNSENSYRILRDKWDLPAGKLKVMTPGVDIDRFIPDPNSHRPEKWTGKLVVLTVGRLQKRKGQDMMIRALPELKSQYRNIHYTIVGGGEERQSLESLAEELGVDAQVEFYGEPDDIELVQLYRHCDVFALPNRRVGNDDEGFGMVLLEAQACGRPVLAGASGGTRETLEEGTTGVLVDCTSPESLVRGLRGLLDGTRSLDQMGSDGRLLVEKKFSWEALAGKARAQFLDQS